MHLTMTSEYGQQDQPDEVASLLALAGACDAISAALDAGWTSDSILSIVGRPQAVLDVADIRCRGAAASLAGIDPHAASTALWVDGLVVGVLFAALYLDLNEGEGRCQ